jgi:hypothetical protein
MKATQNGNPVSLTPFITSVTDWYEKGKKTIQQAEASITADYKAYPVQSTSFDPEKMYVEPLGGKINGHSVFDVQVPFTWTGQRRNGAKKSLSSELQAIIILAGSPDQWRIYAIHNLK